MDYVNQKKLVQEAILVATKKAYLGVRYMLIRGVRSGVFLGFANSLAVVNGEVDVSQSTSVAH